MHTLLQLEKQQVGLRLPKYLLDEIDEFTKHYSLNRTDIIVEALKSYVNEQKSNIYYDQFDASLKELQTVLTTKESSLQSLNELIDDLENK